MVNSIRSAQRVVIHGYYGAGNFGDDIILLSVVTSLLSLIPDLIITVLTRDILPIPHSDLFTVVSRFDIAKTQAAIEEADLFLCGGGGIFQDYSGFLFTDHFGARTKGLDYYALPIEMAYLLQKPIMYYGIGAGPLFSDAAKRYLATVLRWADVITVRDEDSATLIKNLDPATDPIITADPAISYDYSAASYPLADGKHVGMSMRNWLFKGSERENCVRYFANMADHLSLNGYHIVLFPFSMSKTDYQLLSDVESTMKSENHTFVPKGTTLDETLGILPQLDFLIGMRLHSVVVSSSSLIPALAFAYDEKVSRFLRLTHNEDCLLTFDDIAGMGWKQKADTFMSHQSEIKDRLKKVIPSLKRQEKKNAELAISLLRR